MQRKRLGQVAWILAAILLSGCARAEQPQFVVGQQRSITVTFTPLQFQSPTPLPTSTTTATPVPSPTVPGCGESRGQIDRLSIDLEPGQAAAVFRVYFPPCYGEQEEVRYPVLYMLHGQTFNDDQWDRLGIDEAADALITEGHPPFMIVMPLERNTFEEVHLSPFPGGLIEEIIPWVDANYLTCAERRCRAIGGLSRGGAWAFRLGFRYWNLFGSIGLHSTPPFIGDPNQLPGWLKEIPPGELPRVYMDIGKKDWFIAPAAELEEIFVSLGVPHEWYLFNGGHDEEYWSAHVRDYLDWYTRPLVETP